MKPSHVAAVVRRIHNLPTLPSTFKNVMKLIRDPRTSASQVGGVIASDQAMTARLLKLVNSAFYGFPGRITTVTHAIAIIGFNALENLLLANAIFDLFSSRQGASGFDSIRLRDHSIGCASAAKAIAEITGFGEREEFFMAGLIHDVGKVIHDQFLHDEFCQALELAEMAGILIYEAERQIFSQTHSETGEMLAERWRLPPKLTAAVAYHHCPERAGAYSTEAAVVHLADILCRAANIGFPGDSKIPPLNEAAWEELRLNTNMIEPIIVQMYGNIEDASSFLGVLE